MADQIGLESLDRDGQAVVLKFRHDATLDPAWLFRVVQQRGDITLIPPATVKLDLKTVQKRPAPQPLGRKKGSDPVAGGSWWAARAQAGEVKPGFTKDEIMRPAQEDPRREGGLFARVSGLLRELSGGASIG
jgi:hypothetical protein